MKSFLILGIILLGSMTLYGEESEEESLCRVVSHFYNSVCKPEDSNLAPCVRLQDMVEKICRESRQ